MANLLKQKYRRARRLAEFYSFFGNRKLILTASMPRSASTWMYNVTRILLEQQHPNQVSAGWVADYKTLEKKPVHLIKIHRFDKYWAHRADVVLYSYRDVRDAFASAIRKFDIKPKMQFCEQWIEDDIAWKNKANCVMRYEDFVENQENEIRKIANTLEVENYSVENILQQIADLKSTVLSKEKQHDTQSLFHENHATTKGGHGNWSNEINGELLQQIENEFEDWFKNNDYMINL